MSRRAMITTTIQKTINLAPIVLVFTMTVGVLFHDMHIDKATAVAFALPAALATYGAAHLLGGGGEHVHVERASFANQGSVFHSGLPKITPRDNSDRYSQAKKDPMSGGDGNNGQLWPSV